jgi:HK97 gp10 family phage protein
MPDGFSISIDSKSLEDKLKSLGQDVQDRIINTALREGAKVYQAAVSEAAPERLDDETSGTALPPGALKSDVIIQKVPKSAEYAVRFGRLTAHVAKWVDEGHRLVVGGRSKLNKKTGQSTGNGREIGTVPAHPFFREAFETASSEAEKAIETTLTEAVNRAWNK